MFKDRLLNLPPKNVNQACSVECLLQLNDQQPWRVPVLSYVFKIMNTEDLRERWE